MAGRRKRTYDATKRQASAAEARQRILDSARALFSKKGIDAVTLDQVAKKAKVSTASVYAQFKSKAGLLEALTHAVLLGERYRATAAQVEGLTDPVAALRLTASIARGVYQREHQEMGLIRGSSAYSPALRKIETDLEQIRRDLQRERAELVYRSNPALEALGLEKVRDLIWLYTGRDLYRMLVLEQGWSADDYERWLARTLIQTLLPPGA